MKNERAERIHSVINDSFLIFMHFFSYVHSFNGLRLSKVDYVQGGNEL